MSSPKDHAESSSGPVFTARGRPLDSDVNKKGEVDRTILPVPTRQRAFSLRRLPTEDLEQLTKGHPSKSVQSGANREIEVRQLLIAESRLQQQKPGTFSPHLMASKSPVGMQEVEALRFASSMAEEAQSEVNAQNKTQNKLGQLGVANVGGHLGMGFSGKSKEEVAHIKNVEKQMLVLQQHYQSQGKADHWSTQLQGTQVSEVTADGANVCAAKRAAHVANSAAHGADYYLPPIEQRQQMPPSETLPPIKREQIPSPDTLIEMMSPATSVFGGMQKPFSVMQNKSPLFSKQEQDGTTVATRTRSQSVQNMANSCDECQKEFAAKMGQREHK